MYTAMKELGGAVDAAATLAQPSGPPSGGTDGIIEGLPLLIDRIMAEAGVVEPKVAARSISQAAGDLARAVSLVRAWAANLSRVEHCSVTRSDQTVVRRITPAFRAPADGQYLGATMDYARRLLRFDDTDGEDAIDGTVSIASNGSEPQAVTGPGSKPANEFGRALQPLHAEGLVAPVLPQAEPSDRSRTPMGKGAGRGPLLQHLARSDTGALTSLAYSGLRGFGNQADPTLVELTRATVPVRRTHPHTGQPVEIGRVTITTAELALFRITDGTPDPRLTLGFGATVGTVEVRAIAAALLDGGLARAASDSSGTSSLIQDEEYVLTTLDQSEANGFTEHLKLPHHVTFTSDVDAIRRVRDASSSHTPDAA